MNKNPKPLFSFPATPFERLMLVALTDAAVKFRKTAAIAQLEPNNGMCMELTAARIFCDFLGANITLAENAHPEIGAQVQQWLADSLTFWRARRDASIAAGAAKKAKIDAAKNPKELFDAMFGDDDDTVDPRNN